MLFRSKALMSCINGDNERPRGWLLSAVERAELDDYMWHCNRRRFASRLVIAGVDMHSVRELFGAPDGTDDQVIRPS